MDLFLAITQGAGLATASGLRSFLAPLAVGALARADAGVDFSGTDFAFLEATGFLAAVLAVNVAAFLADRLTAGRSPVAAQEPVGGLEGRALPGLLAAGHLGLGAVLFAGSLAERGETAWPGLLAGALVAGAALAIARDVHRGAARRGARETGRFLDLYFDAAALTLAGVCVVAPPASLPALGALAWLALARRRRSGRKHEGLRILR